MRVQTDDALLSLSNVGAEVLYLIGKTVRGRDLDRSRQVLRHEKRCQHYHISLPRPSIWPRIDRSTPDIMFRLTKMILSSFLPSPNTLFVPANQVFFTASQTSTANAGSVWEKVSGEYSNRKLVPCCKESKSRESGSGVEG